MFIPENYETVDHNASELKWKTVEITKETHDVDK